MSILDVIFPRFCLDCHLPGAYICPRCQVKLKYSYQNRCFYCHKGSLNNLTHPKCLNKFNIDGVTSLYLYNNFLRKIIKNIKYRLAKEIWKEFALLIKPVVIEKLAYYSNLSGKLFLQPIPLSKKRLRDRGFNQAFFLCKYFQKFLTLPISDFIIRVKDTKSQAELKNKRERYNNLRGAFKINDHGHPELILGSRIVLVDDVITSGSTVKEAAKILKKFGAIKIYILALAKG